MLRGVRPGPTGLFDRPVPMFAAGSIACELLAIAAIRTRSMQTPFWRAALQVVLGGLLVLLAGIAIGSA